MSNTFLELRGLSYSDKFRFAGILVFVPILKVCLRVFGFNRIVALLKYSVSKKPNDSLGKLTRYSHLLKLFYMVYPFEGDCLPVSLLFWWMTQRAGIETELHFGMRKQGANLIAHAWIEYDGRPLKGDRTVRQKYKAFENPILPTPTR